ncbi:hypothetical protein HHK36_016922 [Tetracentron sinense]|uniref:Phytocyanin domain-containing protein n=1 Tax=Tetracentron sinense TaxID=13715 RepID=A0A835DCD1_TETSI|nr:hypothetical protein HHK36_016922 [Tetracentron sinense]
MATQSGNLVILGILVTWLSCSFGLQHKVGDSVWSIPATPDFYSNWSANRFFQVDDTLVFEFQSEFHNVMQVSRREYDNCTAENPFRDFWVGPAIVPLIQEGVSYFICSIANYCFLGQKLSVAVHHRSSTPSPPALAPGLDNGRPQDRVRGSNVAPLMPDIGDYPSDVPVSVESSLSLVSAKNLEARLTELEKGQQVVFDALAMVPSSSEVPFQFEVGRLEDEENEVEDNLVRKLYYKCNLVTPRTK